MAEDAFDSDGESEEDIYSAAYEEVVYRDSTDDGIDGEIIGPEVDGFGLTEEARRISERLGFIVTTMRLWKYVVATALAQGVEQEASLCDRFTNWLTQSLDQQKKLLAY